MAKLPTEQDIGDLPDRLPRRQGVGGWQPNDLARGAQDIARGGQQLGIDLGMYAGQEQRLQNEAETAAAASQAAVSHIQTAQAVTSATQPDQVYSLREGYEQNAQDAASLIRDPNARQKFLLEQAPKVAEYQVGADNRATGLVKNQAIADFSTTSNGLINSAVNTDDEGQRAAALGAIVQKGQSLVSQGILTPEEWAEKARETAHDYAAARVESEIARAKQTGDTSRLENLSKLFTFNPGEWGVGAPTGAPGPVDAPAQRVATYAPQIMAASAKYGVSPEYLAKTIYIESKGDPNADNGFARGLTQFSDATAAQYGVNQKDPASSINGAAAYAVDNRKALTSALGRPPTDAELYIAHQQGPGGVKLLTNPNTPAGQLVSPAAIKANGGDPNAPAKQFTDMWIQKFNSTPTAIGGGAPAAPSGQPSAAPRAVGDSLARGVGGVTGVMNAATGANPEQVLSLIRGQDVTTTHKDANGKTVTETAKGLTDSDLKSGPIVLSSGASNNPADVELLGAQLGGLKARGVDLSKVTVLGVGTRSDFQQAGVNATLQSIAKKYGAKFQPLDPGMMSPDGVHPVAQGYTAIAQQVGGAAGPGGGGATVQPAAFVGVPPPGAAGPNPHLAPPQSQWPQDARGVEQQPDGSFSYVMSEGNKVPVPGTRASGASGAPSPGNTGTIMDALKPQERAELGLRLQNEINSIQSAKQAQDNQYAKAAVSDLKSRVESMTSGAPLGPNEAASLKPYAESPIPEVRKAYAETMMIRDNLASYQGKSPAAVQADVAAKEAAYNAAREQYPNSPAIETMGLILNAAKKYAETYAGEAAKQPLERAVKSGLLPNGIAPLSPDDPNIEAALARRVSDAKTASDALGVPTRYLQQTERPLMKQIAQAGGEPMVDLAMHIVKAAGADAPAIFKEIGVDAPMFQKIGELAAGGGDPEAVRDIASVINAKNDKAARGDLPTFTDKMLSKFTDPMADVASRFGPDFAGRTRAAANMLMSAQAQRDGWDPKIDPTNANLNQQFFDRAYDLATGATFGPDGTKYGGVVDRNAKNYFGPSNKVIVPNTIKADDFHSVVSSITDPDLKALPNAPMGKNGAPVTAAQIRDGRLEALPDRDGIFRGKYAVFTDGVRDDNHLVRDASGKPWALDFAQPQLDAALRARNPNSFLAKTPTAAPSAPDRYKSTPGMIATAGESLAGAAETE